MNARVFHLTLSLDFGGVESHLRNLAEWPLKRHEHVYVALRSGGEAHRQIEATGARVHVLNLCPWSRPLATLAGLISLFRKERPDIVHTHGSDANISGLVAAFLAGVEVRIGEEIGVPDHSFKARHAFKVAYWTAQRVIGVSEVVRDKLIANNEIPTRKAVRLYNPVAMATDFASPRQDGEPLRIAFLGRLEPIKNAVALIRAVALLPDDINWELLLIGDGSDKDALVEAAQIEGIASRVRFCGFVRKPAELLTTCHLYVQPSISEGFGIALVEAMSCGLPAIVTSRGGMAEVVKHDQTGWVLPSPCPALVAEAIQKAASLPPAVLAALGASARLSVRDQFSVERYVVELEQLYDDCLGTPA